MYHQSINNLLLFHSIHSVFQFFFLKFDEESITSEKNNNKNKTKQQQQQKQTNKKQKIIVKPEPLPCVLLF